MQKNLFISSLVLVSIGLAGLFITGVVAFLLVRYRYWRPWMAYVTATMDVAVLTANLWFSDVRMNSSRAETPQVASNAIPTANTDSQTMARLPLARMTLFCSTLRRGLLTAIVANNQSQIPSKLTRLGSC